MAGEAVYYGTGRRKNAVARVRIVPGTGKVTGAKAADKIYYRHSGYVGGLKSETFTEAMEKHPERVIEHAVKGMLPKNTLGRAMGKKLKVYVGPEHPHAAQKPREIKIDEVML